MSRQNPPDRCVEPAERVMNLRPFVRQWPCLLLALAAWLAPGFSHAAGPMSRAQALHALAQEQPAGRLAAVDRLAAIGTMADAPRVAERLRDADPDVRERAGAALWSIWSRSGDRAIDRLLAKGIEQMGNGDLEAADATFTQVVQRRPAFAEGWNKRATVRFMLGQDTASLKDCDEVLKRNPLHFGALSGMTQIHARMGEPVLALRAYERALQVNPNLKDAPEVLQLLEEAVRQQGVNRT
jgi:tetratricopeptide (TPR) repeat protein